MPQKNYHKTIIHEPRKCWVNDTRKICYNTEEEAEMTARSKEYEHSLPPNSLSYYACEHCGKYHLSNTNPNKNPQ